MSDGVMGGRVRTMETEEGQLKREFCVLHSGVMLACRPLFKPRDLPATPLCAAGAVESINHMQCHPTSPSKIKSHEPWLKGTYRTEKVSEDGAFVITLASAQTEGIHGSRTYAAAAAAAAAQIHSAGKKHTIQ